MKLTKPNCFQNQNRTKLWVCIVSKTTRMCCVCVRVCVCVCVYVCVCVCMCVCVCVANILMSTSEKM